MKIHRNFYNVGSRSTMKIFIFIKITKNSIKNREIYAFLKTWVREISRNFSKSGSKITKIAKITIFHTKKLEIFYKFRLQCFGPFYFLKTTKKLVCLTRKLVSIFRFFETCKIFDQFFHEIFRKSFENEILKFYRFRPQVIQKIA